MIRPLRPSVLLFACLMSLAGGVLALDAEAVDDGEGSDSLRAQATAIRKAAEREFKHTEAACYDRFRVNACLDDAREARTVQLQAARKLEARANRIDRGERIKAMEARLKEAEERRARPMPVPLLPAPAKP
ncbi:hypothetical protein [Denitromonas iodatirespirans]|uniref:DUF4398 domain-containing protein n=1 Tax=Denitromonas iodatirespirans TaxID=2795389 RepID=A0A944D8R9_DENI1|nr:hypothetical protein [Denitromonas iodatirespirans]MBT0960002.1 hypothetical protein [Denitromonas iodatirespirans]